MVSKESFGRVRITNPVELTCFSAAVLYFVIRLLFFSLTLGDLGGLLIFVSFILLCAIYRAISFLIAILTIQRNLMEFFRQAKGGS